MTNAEIIRALEDAGFHYSEMRLFGGGVDKTVRFNGNLNDVVSAVLPIMGHVIAEAIKEQQLLSSSYYNSSDFDDGMKMAAWVADRII